LNNFLLFSGNNVWTRNAEKPI